MKLPVYNKNGEPTGREIELSEEVFGITPSEHALYLAVRLYNANQRQGTHKAKERWEVSGSTRKLHKQKGTGGSRKGDINSPLFPGGGRVFGPRPRDYGFKINKKVKALARRSALAARAQEGNIRIIEDFDFDQPRTKDYIAFLGSLNLETQKTLLLTPNVTTNIVLSSRNVKKANVCRATDFNVYDVLNSSTLLVFENAIPVIEASLAN